MHTIGRDAEQRIKNIMIIIKISYQINLVNNITIIIEQKYLNIHKEDAMIMCLEKKRDNILKCNIKKVKKDPSIYIS